MKIAVSSSGNNLDSQIDPRFGRCTYLVIVETDDMSFEVFENENIALTGGAGIQTASFVASKGSKVVITGNCGPKATDALSAAEIKIITGQSGIIKDVVEKFKNGNLVPLEDSAPSTKPDASPKVAIAKDQGQQASGGMGMGGGGRCMGGGGGGRGKSGGGRGMGGGGGMGMGGGRGMGGGGGAKMEGGYETGMPGQDVLFQKNAGVLSREDELKLLKQQSEDLGKHMEEIESRIKDLK